MLQKFSIQTVVTITLMGIGFWLLAFTASAETIVTNSISVSANSGQNTRGGTRDGQASVELFTISTVGGETTSYTYSETATSSVSHEVITTNGITNVEDIDKKVQYLSLLQQLQLLLTLLTQKI